MLEKAARRGADAIGEVPYRRGIVPLVRTEEATPAGFLVNQDPSAGCWCHQKPAARRLLVSLRNYPAAIGHLADSVCWRQAVSS